MNSDSDSQMENPTSFWTTFAVYSLVGLCAFLFGTIVLINVLNNSYGWQNLLAAGAVVTALGYALQYALREASDMVTERYSE